MTCSQAGVASKQDFERGYDHGTFVTLGVAWPQADVPLAVLSLDASLDPEARPPGSADRGALVRATINSDPVPTTRLCCASLSAPRPQRRPGLETHG